MDTQLGPLGYSITLKTIPPHFLENIRSELNVKPLENPHFNFGENTSYPVYRISKTKFIFHDIMELKITVHQKTRFSQKETR